MNTGRWVGRWLNHECKGHKVEMDLQKPLNPASDVNGDDVIWAVIYGGTYTGKSSAI